MWRKIFSLERIISVIGITLFGFFTLWLLSVHVLIGILFLVISLYLRHLIRFVPPQGACYLWLGVPGSGKTTIAAYIALWAQKHNVRCFSNVPIAGTYRYNWKNDFGHYDMSDSIILCDEAGVELNGRNWKANFSQESLDTTKKFRHYEMTLHFFSQASDEDPIVRNLSMKTFVVTKPVIPYFVKIRAISQAWDILETTRQRALCESWQPFSTQYIFCPPAWKLFDTLECRPLPKKRWEKW